MIKTREGDLTGTAGGPKTANEPEEIYRRRHLPKITGCAMSTIYLMMERGEFPRPIELNSARSKGWLRSDILEWQRKRIQASRSAEAS